MSAFASSDSSAALNLDQLRLSCRACSLQELCLPATLRKHELGQLADLLGHSTYRAGEHVYNDGDRFHALYVVRSGMVKTWVTSLNGSLQILGFHLPGELFGLDGVSEHRHRCSAELLETSEVCRVPFDQLERVANRVPALQRQLLRIISREFLLEQEHLVMMGGRPAIERVALFLQTLSQRRALLGFDRRALELGMTRADIGNYLALATETVSRVLARLQRLGVIHLDRHRLEILDLQRLIDIAGEDLGLHRYPD